MFFLTVYRSFLCPGVILTLFLRIMTILWVTILNKLVFRIKVIWCRSTHFFSYEWLEKLLSACRPFMGHSIVLEPHHTCCVILSVKFTYLLEAFIFVWCNNSVFSDPAAGGSHDWTKGVAGIKYSYTVELPDRGFFGFLLPAYKIIPVGEETLELVKSMAEDVMQEYHNSTKTSVKKHNGRQ